MGTRGRRAAELGAVADLHALGQDVFPHRGPLCGNKLGVQVWLRKVLVGIVPQRDLGMCSARDCDRGACEDGEHCAGRLGWGLGGGRDGARSP